jgi:LysM repeat protein
MNDFTAWTPWLLLAMLLLPTGGALLARVIARWAGARVVPVVGGAACVGAIVCVIALQTLPVNADALGRLRIFVPSSDLVIASESLITIPTAGPIAAQLDPTATAAAPTRTPTDIPTPTDAPTTTPEPTTPPPPTEVPPTEVPPTATSAPTAAPPPPTEPPVAAAPTRVPDRSQPLRYEVQSGDTLRGIAERFDVTVEELLRYNGLTPEEGDSLRVGQVLYIPPR